METSRVFQQPLDIILLLLPNVFSQIQLKTSNHAVKHFAKVVSVHRLQKILLLHSEQSKYYAHFSQATYLLKIKSLNHNFLDLGGNIQFLPLQHTILGSGYFTILN